MKTSDTVKLMRRLPFALLLAAAVVLAVSPAAQAQRPSLSGLQQQIDDVDQDVQNNTTELGTVQNRLDAVEQALCDLAAGTGQPAPPFCGPVDGDLRLVDGAAANEGRLEMLWQGQWGTVCDDRWDINDATVACKQLGYTGADAALYTLNVVDGTGPILLDDVQCTGTEAKLLDCVTRLPVGSHNCSHFEDAGVRCTLN